MSIELANLSMHDGSRYFGGLPTSASWYQVRDHVSRLAGAELTDFITDGVTEAWIDFTYHAHAFSINDQFGEYWFFVRDPSCEESVLRTVLQHFQQLVG